MQRLSQVVVFELNGAEDEAIEAARMMGNYKARAARAAAAASARARALPAADRRQVAPLPLAR